MPEPRVKRSDHVQGGVVAARENATGIVSKEARAAAHFLLEAAPLVRRKVLRDLNTRDLQYVLQEVERETGSMYGLYQDTPSGFIEDVIGETVWGRQREVLDAIVDYKRVIVPAGFGVGKTWGAGRLVAWAGAVNPIGSLTIVTTATRFRQVRFQLWPHIATAVNKGDLPGKCDTTQWKAPDRDGNTKIVAYGFSAPDNDEAAMQGIHGTPKLLLVVDEAGGISRLIGRGTNNLLTGDAKMLAIGNPPMDDPGSWFEHMSTEGEDESEPTTATIRIAAVDSPAITGERTPICRACVPNHDGHTIAGGNPSHLPDKDWLDRTLREYGDVEHPYVVAKVFAKFPKTSGNRIIPSSWVDGAVRAIEPTDPGYVALNALGLEGETSKNLVKRGSWVRLGVDVAADGGDEFVIARAVGDMVEIRHTSSGAANADSVHVSEVILEEILQAERLAAAIGSTAVIHVKVDTIGVGWGVYGTLKRMGENGRHKALIVAVNVAESPAHKDESSTMRPSNKRAEMWLATRTLVQPDPHTGEGLIRLRIDTKTAAQLATPNIGYTSTGLVTVETKKSMKQRGVHSPDRAEAVLLVLYEITGTRRKRGLIA